MKNDINIADRADVLQITTDTPYILSSADLDATQDYISDAIKLISQGVKESNLRETFAFHLGRMFPTSPWWVTNHVQRGEAKTAFAVEGLKKRGFVDNLVGMTAIEYEANLNDPNRFRSGYGQVGNYCAALLNQGFAPDLVLGVLSDTVRWRAYRIRAVNAPLEGQLLGGEHLDLEEIEQLELTAPDDLNARRLIAFLMRYLGREGSRPLNATTIARDLGFESSLRADHAEQLMASVKKTLNDSPVYAQLIEELWRDFVGYLGEEAGQAWNPSSYRSTYAAELYILTLAKLLCANVLEKGSLQSDDSELKRILDGEYFRAKGLTNLVEYDYFGWLNSSPHVEALLPVSRQIQNDLRAYDFTSQPVEDLFGRLMAQLAHQTQRLLLGQEWTPAWLAERLVKHALELLPENTPPRFVDMSCGSGAMVVETLKRVMESHREEADPSVRISLLTSAITGFDIDPLAVMLSKIGWIIATRSWLEPLDGSNQVSIPIYHADSLFAATPLSRLVETEIVRTQRHQDGIHQNKQNPPVIDSPKVPIPIAIHRLHLAEYEVEMPSFLVSPARRDWFDSLLGRAYSLSNIRVEEIESSVIEEVIQDVSDTLDSELKADEKSAVFNFLSQLVRAITTLNHEGRNGIWSFILRNSYRPGLLRGQFNGLVANPPWLALSRIGSNPYREQLRSYAQAYDIMPPGPSHLHLELATIFLLHAVEQYLAPGAVCGCILPETVLSGYQHQPWRVGAFRHAPASVPLNIEEVWRIQTGTFKNEAVIVFGHKANKAPASESNITGALVSATSVEPRTFRVVTQGKRNAWTDNTAVGRRGDGFFNPASFRQGADVMPRTLFFHEVGSRSGSRVHLSPIDRANSGLRFLVKDAKNYKSFRITPRYVPDRFLFDVLTSNLLTPFHLAQASKGFLPIRKNVNMEWEPIPSAMIATSPDAKAAWDEILEALGAGTTIEELYAMLDTDRRKLTTQTFPTSGYLIVQGAGGGIVCAAYVNLSDFDVNRLVVDQTLYSATVNSEENAIYLTGLLNSQAVGKIIKDFQPRGSFGERHVHKLALGVTPPFDVAQEAHLEVVRTTRQLIASYNILLSTDIALNTQLDSNKALAARRTRLRKALEKLPEYDNYDEACHILYGVDR